MWGATEPTPTSALAFLNIQPKDGYDYVVYSCSLCVVIQLLVRQLTLLIMGADHPKRGAANPNLSSLKTRPVNPALTQAWLLV